MTSANTIVSDEMLSAYLDGELEPAEAARVATLIASNAELAARLARHRRVDDLLREAIPEIPTPDYDPLVEHILGAAPARRSFVSARSGLALAAALTVAVLAGVGLGRYLPRNDGLQVAAGGLVAHGPLAEALEHQASMSVSGRAPIQVALSLRAADGRFCREFFVKGATEGVACREAAGWRVLATAEQRAASGDASGYRTAGGEDGPLDKAVQDLAGAPLDPAAEARALQQGWR
jgi:Putative zinc-finger